MPGLPTIYKRYQGQYSRSITAAVLAAVLLALCYFTYAMLYKYVQTDKAVTREVKNVAPVPERWLFGRSWPSDQAAVYPVDTPATQAAMKAMDEAGVTRWVFRPAHPVHAALYYQYGVPSLLFALGALGIFLLVNRPRFADFLIATEGEMKKVSWSSKAELIGSTAVVIVTVLILAVLIYAADLVWTVVFKTIGVLPG